ncbi:MAG: hypothetical protein Q8941_13125 [Bacteroidota bacterium]|nr:hypothetical protein [Bacteroidota bacterium]
MKQLIILCLAAICMLPACNNNKPKQATIVSDDGKTKVTVNPADIAEKAGDMNQKMEELKKLTPLTLDQLKALLPEEFMGMKRSSFNANAMMGTSTCTATYKTDDGKQLRVSLFDGAGEAGASLVGLRFYNLWNFERQDDNGYEKTVDFNGGKAIEKYAKYNDEYGLTYVANDRLLVSLEGEKMGLDAIKDAAKNLSLK